MRDGDAIGKKFGGDSGDDPDWFKLTVTGKDDAGTVLGSVDFYLADYRFETNALDYIVGDWTWVDLSAFGPQVKTLHFTLSSSDNGAWGMNTPAYFAMDDIQFIYTFSTSAGGANLYDTPVPGFVGPHGDGRADIEGDPHPSNYVNRAFAGWAAEVVDYSPAPDVGESWRDPTKALGPVTGNNTNIVSLGDLACHPDVQSGTLDLTNVHYVRIIDIPGNGGFFDTFSPSNAVYDAWYTYGSGGLDLEAVGVLNSPGYARVKTRAVGPGRISPYGMPDGVVAVAHGSNVTFSIIANPGYHLVDVLVNGVGQGAVTNCVFTNVLSDQTLTAVFGSRLVIESPYGSSDPGAGTHYGFGPFEVSLAGSPFSAGTTQYVCRGWTGTGSVSATGTGTFTQFDLTNDSILVWAWETNYWLSVAAAGEGAVEAPIGWQEFYAGTDPNDPDSIFKIIDFGVSAGSNYVVWVGGTNGTTRPFSVLSSPALAGGWSVLDGRVVRSASGTNIWWGTLSPSNAFYRIEVNTGL
jgi:hypothetical protein